MRTVAFLTTAIVLSACSTDLIPGAESVRQITPAMTNSCSFVGPVTTSESMGIDVAADVESAYNKVRNAAVQMGGNSFVVSSSSTSTETTVVQADVYLCR